ncbi:hypothetical protein [Peribacillus sp. SCS-155]|uniref:hypothetical protein n=1 Tax=Peribacillus sedimenti TaxID=3115297 RepID=UPI0039068123
MNKPAKQNQITIKINGKDNSFYEDSAEKEIIDIEAGEEAETAATIENQLESFDWNLPEEQNEGNDGHFSLSKKNTSPVIFSASDKRKRKATIIKAPLIAVVCAILLGTCFGYAVLKMVTSTDRKAVPVAAPAVESRPVAAAPEVVLPSINSFMVQGGVFSSEQAARKVQEKLTDSSVPVEVLRLDNRFYIFLGMADSLEKAKSLAGYYKLKKVDAFWKEITVSGKGTGSEDDKKVLGDMLALYQELAKNSAALLLGTEAKAEVKTAAAKINSLKPKANSAHAKELNDMRGNLKASADLIEKYQSSSESTMLELSQEQLLFFLKNYQALLSKE